MIKFNVFLSFVYSTFRSLDILILCVPFSVNYQTLYFQLVDIKFSFVFYV